MPTVMPEDGGMDSNMIKSKKIIEQYLENLYCDKCGKLIPSPSQQVLDEYPWNPPLYKYECPCGWTTKDKTLYPFVRMDFEEDDEIEKGDEVEAWDTNAWVTFIAWGKELGSIYGIGEDGNAFEYPISSCRKTGRRFELKLIENNMY